MSDEVSVKTVHQIIEKAKVTEEEMEKEERREENAKNITGEVNDEVREEDSGKAKKKPKIEENHNSAEVGETLKKGSNEEQQEIDDIQSMEEQNVSDVESGLNAMQEKNMEKGDGEVKDEEFEEDTDDKKIEDPVEDQDIKADEDVPLQENVGEDAEKELEEIEMCDALREGDDAFAQILADGWVEHGLMDLEELQERLGIQEMNHAAFCADAAKHRSYIRQSMSDNLHALKGDMGPNVSEEERRVAEELIELQRRGDEIEREFLASYQQHLLQRRQLEAMIEHEMYLRNALQEMINLLDAIENEPDDNDGNDEDGDENQDDDDDDVFQEPSRKNCRNGS